MREQGSGKDYTILLAAFIGIDESISQGWHGTPVPEKGQSPDGPGVQLSCPCRFLEELNQGGQGVRALEDLDTMYGKRRGPPLERVSG